MMASSSQQDLEKFSSCQHVEALENVEKYSPHAYKSDAGLRMDDDDEDHNIEPPMTFHRFMSFASMSVLWIGSQLPVYIFGGIPPIIYGDIGGADRWTWFVIANLVSLAAVCPFVGSLSDLFGRRYVALFGGILVCIGMAVCSTATTMNIFICGMAVSGVGAGINELTALAATSEMAPTRKRGKYVAILIFTIVPFCPSVLWAQLIAANAGWRYCGLLCGVWAAIALAMTAAFYFPPPRINSRGLSRKEILSKIDLLGGFLSISGILMFIAGLMWGGYQYEWTSAHVLTPLMVGVALLIAFGVWEVYGASNPMFPHRLRQDPRILSLTLLITFISGANFFSLLMFWPSQAFNVYGHDPVGVGIRGLPVGFGILTGACICLWLLSMLKGHNKELMIASSIFMTAGCGALAVADRDNLNTVWVILIIGSLGIGGIVVPASIITTIICPDDLIATVSALTLAIRVLGGSVGYTVYYNVFATKFKTNSLLLIGGLMQEDFGITNMTYIVDAIQLTAASLLPGLRDIPGIADNETRYELLVLAGQVAYAQSYKYVYYTSIGFGCVSIIAACLLGDIEKYMDDHIAVILH